VYNDEIASFIGAKPSIWRHPALAWHLLLGSCGAYQYRLQGPGTWPRAAEYVRKAPPPPLYKWTVVALSVPLVLFLIRWALLRAWARQPRHHLLRYEHS